MAIKGLELERPLRCELIRSRKYHKAKCTISVSNHIICLTVRRQELENEKTISQICMLLVPKEVNNS